jgi:hypothetical protein
MMVLHPDANSNRPSSPSTTSSTSNSSSNNATAVAANLSSTTATTATRSESSLPIKSGSERPAVVVPQLRRRRSKGTIADLTRKSPSSGNESGLPVVTTANEGALVNSSSQASSSSTLEDSVSPQQQHLSTISSSSKDRTPQQQSPLHKNTESMEVANPSTKSFIPNKPNHVSKLALLCAQNAMRLGARTQLYLCPPGKVRRTLQSELLRHSSRFANSGSTNSSDVGLDHMVDLTRYEQDEQDFLRTSNSFQAEQDEDDEEHSSGDEDDPVSSFTFPDNSSSIVHSESREPLFTPFGRDLRLSNPNGAPVLLGGSGSLNNNGRLAFNRRKLRFFDAIAPQDSATARAYLRCELNRSKKRAALSLSRHLKRVHMEEVRRKRTAQGEIVDDLVLTETPEERALLSGTVSKLQAPMTPSLAAALLLESLKVGRPESIEGMSKCYDGIVAAGTAVLDSMESNPASQQDTGNKSRATRSEIVAALAPLLITSLEQPSGELFVLLAKLRQMCGTVRYQRRFVQRVAPCLIRPPNSAMWCLKHQNDMESILAATELILDSAMDIFSKGWYERGQLLLADTKRAETLKAAAKQLRDLSSEPTTGSLALSGTGNGLTTTARARRLKNDSGVSGANNQLAEWEVIAVDRQIRVSIANALKSDWSRSTIQSEIKSHYRRPSPVNKAALRAIPSGSSDMSPKSMVSSSPRSPARIMIPVASTPKSPPHLPSVQSSTAEVLDNVFGPSFAEVNVQSERAFTPPPHNSQSNPAMPQLKVFKDDKQLEFAEAFSSSPQSNQTPPRSPHSPKKAETDTLKFTENAPALTPLSSPIRGKVIGGKEVAGASHPSSSAPTTPLSPSSIGSAEIVSYKPVSAATVPSSSGSTAHYRMLTSTAAERKRTVAACRALRAQIQRFEDAFLQLHGRSPKGAVERAPLATTYAQYREWKRAIRADAACRIQALFRGFRTRTLLLQGNRPEILRVVSRRAGRSDFTLPDLNLPSDIGDSEPTGSLTSSTENESLFETSEKQPSGLQWASKQLRPRANSGDRSGSPGSLSSSKSQSATLSTVPSALTIQELKGMTLPELQARKRDLKSQLKQYDMHFARKHGRMPIKAEKEPIRHLYESYNFLKTQITTMEHEQRRLPPPLKSPSSSVVVFPQRTVSPTSGSESGQSATEDAGFSASPKTARGKRKVPKSASPPIASAPSAASSKSSLPTDLASLKIEKGQLHQMLRSYEKDFFREHKRQVSSFADIKPVASQYRRYKEIKRAIAAQQQMGR